MMRATQGNVRFANDGYPSLTPASAHSLLHIWERVGRGEIHEKEIAALHEIGFEEDKVSFQIEKVRHRVRYYDRRTWTDEHIRKVLLRAFPKLHTDPDQRAQAGRWARVIQLYFRVGLSLRETAPQLNMTFDAAHSVVRSLQRTSKKIK